MDLNLPMGNWIICGDFNHTKFLEDSVGPTPPLHGLERRVGNRLSNKLDLIDNRLMLSLKPGLILHDKLCMGKNSISLAWVGAMTMTKAPGWNSLAR